MTFAGSLSTGRISIILTGLRAVLSVLSGGGSGIRSGTMAAATTDVGQVAGAIVGAAPARKGSMLGQTATPSARIRSL